VPFFQKKEIILFNGIVLSRVQIEIQPIILASIMGSSVAASALRPAVSWDGWILRPKQYARAEISLRCKARETKTTQTSLAVRATRYEDRTHGDEMSDLAQTQRRAGGRPR
jgi:hypothetical protein